VRGLLEYENVPKIVGSVVSHHLATFHELDTVYGTEDLYDMIEIIAVDNHNQRVINKPRD
jgi:4-diphosphocytidyl-2C-methyl-D-erythritol kinase